MDFQRVAKKVLRVIFIAILLLTVFPFAARGIVVWWGHQYISGVTEAPQRRVAMVFGARVYYSGRPSPMLADRVSAAADLYHAGKVDILLMTGAAEELPAPDGSVPASGYNEPNAMRDYAISLGVPADDIVVDYGGLRTYDSCYRARYIFGVTDAVLVTQNFHLPRALMTCQTMGIDAVGVRADDQRRWGYSRRSLAYSRTREIPATALAVIDLLRREEPPVMGEPLPIFPTEAVD